MFAFAPDPGSAASGTLDANLDIKASTSGLDDRGRLHIREARIPIAPSVGTLRKADIDIVISNKEIKVNAAGKLGKGDITANGQIAINGVDLDGGTFKVVLEHVSPIGSLEPRSIRRSPARWAARARSGSPMSRSTRRS